MDNPSKFKFPVFVIKKVRPLVRKDNKVFAYEIIAITEFEESFKIYETKGLNLSEYINKKVECLVEITNGKFEYRDNNEKPPEDVTSFYYQWFKRPYEFFPELVELKNDLHEANSLNENDLTKHFNDTALKLFSSWGLNGLNIDKYQAKPLFNSSLGFFLLNEYEFEEEIENLELNEEVYIRIDELFLRGIRPIEPITQSEQQQSASQPKPQSALPEPEKAEAPEEKKRRRTFFFD
ncbi:MAG: hypothetical protein ABJB11_23050 [Ferruginibacter sp.]